MLILSLSLLLLGTPALAQDRTRVDFYDTHGQRDGYALVDRNRGVVDYYDQNGKRIGYGVVQPDGGVNTYDGRRSGTTIVPPPRPEKKR